jgi:shikimate dehydrogenase
VNCIRFDEEGLKGYNTDVKGFAQSFLPLLQPHQSKALILGTGGSAKAVQYVLTQNNISFLSVSRSSGGPGIINYEDIEEDILWEYPVIINCTPVGMSPHEEEQPPLPYHFLGKENLLYDLIYSPAKTKFLQQGEKKGCIIKNGMEMLELQAAENWNIWNL